jgi:hypothetical protein
MKSHARTALGALRERVINDPDPDVRSSALLAIQEIDGDLRGNADRMLKNELTESMSIIRPILDDPVVHDPIDKAMFDKVGPDLSSTMNSLKRSLSSKTIQRYLDVLYDNMLISVILLYTFLCILFWSVVSVVRPPALVSMSESLTRLPSIPIPKMDVQLSWAVVRWATFLALFDRKPRVLDQWVAERLSRARESFGTRVTVKDRLDYVTSVPLTAQGVLHSAVDDGLLTDIFRHQHATLLIDGPPGSGKTSLACYIAHRASMDEHFVGPHPMLPVLIEPELVTELDVDDGDGVADPKTAKRANMAGHSGLIELIRGLLRSYLDEPHAPSTHLVESLLRSRRVLVIVDRYSDMVASKKRWLNLFAPDSPVNALIVTASSPHPELRTRSNWRPQPIPVDDLGRFISVYLEIREKDSIFECTDIQKAIADASGHALDASVRAAVVKQVVDMMIIEKSKAPILTPLKNLVASGYGEGAV